MPDQTDRTQAWMAAIPVGLTFVGLAAWSWGRWTDPQIDFGNELYIAWQLSEGKELYGDIAHRNGPLSHYWNALLFRCFGVSLTTLVWANLGILAGCCGLAFTLLRRFAGVIGAALATLALLTIFAFGQYGEVANYNFVTPYHHFQTHGVALGLLLLMALLRALETPRNTWAAIAGVCFGGLLLTKLELWAPGLVASALGVALWFRAQREAAPRFVCVFAAGSLLLPAISLAWLARSMPWHQALSGLLGNLNYLGTAFAGDAFYRAGAGLDDPWNNALRIAGVSLALAGIAASIALADRWLTRRSISPRLRLALGATLCLGLAIGAPTGLWFTVAACLPVVAGGSALAAASACARRGSDATRLRAPAALLLFAIWSTALLGKLFLAPRFHHYGFALAMPATLLLVALWVAGLPALARRLGGGGTIARTLAVAIAAAAMLGCLRASDARYRFKTLWIGPPGDAMRVDSAARAPRGQRLELLRQRLSERLPPDATLLVYPEGAQLNYWLRRSSPSRFVIFLPTELDAFGREAVRADLRRAAPDFIALLHRGHAEFGVGPFGEDPDNGRGIVSWVHDEYELVDRIGPDPFRSRGFGAEIWQRKGTHTPRPPAPR